MRFRILFFVLLFMLLGFLLGCATTPITPDENKRFEDEFRRYHPIPNIPPQIPVIPRRMI